jgi:hypothetical protein
MKTLKTQTIRADENDAGPRVSQIEQCLALLGIEFSYRFTHVPSPPPGERTAAHFGSVLS